MSTAPEPGRVRVPPTLPVVIAVVASVVALVVLFASGDAGRPSAATTTTVPTSSTSSTTTAPTTTTLPAPRFTAAELRAMAEARPLSEFDEPAAYRIDYDVVENGLARTERLLVRRPYESVVVAERDDAVLTGTATSLTGLRTYLSEQDGWITVQPELHRAAFDLRIAPALGVMEALGFVVTDGEVDVDGDAGTYAGRACSRFRTGQPTGLDQPEPPTPDDHVDVCIDDAGLVLHQRWVLGGQTVTEQTATSVELEPDIDTDDFEGGPTVEDDEELRRVFGSLAVAADDETIDSLRTVVEPPSGYVLDGVVFRTSPSGQGGSETVRFYSRGPELLEVSEVFAAGGITLEDPSAFRVESDHWGEVWFAPGFRNSELRVRLGSSSYLAIRHPDPLVILDVFDSAYVDD